MYTVLVPLKEQSPQLRQELTLSGFPLLSHSRSTPPPRRANELSSELLQDMTLLSIIDPPTHIAQFLFPRRLWTARMTGFLEYGGFFVSTLVISTGWHSILHRINIQLIFTELIQAVSVRVQQSKNNFICANFLRKELEKQYPRDVKVQLE